MSHLKYSYNNEKILGCYRAIKIMTFLSFKGIIGFASLSNGAVIFILYKGKPTLELLIMSLW